MTAIAVVGLHRGGTSAVAGVLHNLGVFMGDELLPPSKHNPKGYFEDRRFVELHTKILGGDWKDPPYDFMENWYKYKDEYMSLVSEFDKHEHWGVKDPRLCYCLPCLRIATGNTLKVICVFRNPWNSANSLHTRGGHTWDEAFAISMRYMAAMMLCTENYGVVKHLAPRPQPLYIDYDRLLDAPAWYTSAIAGLVGVPFKQEAADSLDVELRHYE